MHFPQSNLRTSFIINRSSNSNEKKKPVESSREKILSNAYRIVVFAVISLFSLLHNDFFKQLRQSLRRLPFPIINCSEKSFVPTKQGGK